LECTGEISEGGGGNIVLGGKRLLCLDTDLREEGRDLTKVKIPALQRSSKPARIQLVLVWSVDSGQQCRLQIMRHNEANIAIFGLKSSFVADRPIESRSPTI
jgi:hypothetical protein